LIVSKAQRRLQLSVLKRLVPADRMDYITNPLNAKLNPSCHLLALLGAHHILYVSRIRVKTILSLTTKTQHIIYTGHCTVE